MSLIPCITLANLTTPVTQLGGVGDNPTFSTITAETLQLNGVAGQTTVYAEKKLVNDILVGLVGAETGAYPINQSGNVNTEYFVRKPNTIIQSLGAIGFDTLRTTRVNNQYDMRLYNGQGGRTASLIVDGFAEIDATGTDVYSSTVTTQAVFIEGQVLTADNDQLFLNGIPVATSANVSSIADWSYYAQVSTLDGNNQNIKSINNIQAFSGSFSSITTNVMTVNTLVSQSTINNYSTINTVDIIADEGNISTLTGSSLTFTTLNGQANFTSTLTLGQTTTGLLSVNGAGDLLYNGSTITAGGGGSASNWSANPALQTVNFNTYGFSNAGALLATSLATTGNIATLCNMAAGGTVTGNNVTGTNGVFGSGVSVSGNVNSATVTTGAVTSSGLVNCQNGLNATGDVSIIGGLGQEVILATDANTNGIRLQTGAMLLTCPAAFSLNAGGAGNLSAGGAISIAAGNYIELNAGYIDVIGGSIIKVNSIQPQSGSLSIGSTSIVNSGGIYTNVLSAPSIVPSLVGQTSSIVGIDLIANSNSFVSRNMITSTFTVSTINTVPVNSILPNPPTFQIYVSKNGSDTTGTGSIMQPFLTITKALTTASAFSDTNIVTILLTPGNFTETVTVSRNNTFINGLSTNSQEVSITGAVSFPINTQTVGFINAGIVGITINGSLAFSTTSTVPTAFTAISGVINGIAGTIPLTLSTTSTSGNVNYSSQSMVIVTVDTIAISLTNVKGSFVLDNVRGTTTLLETFGNSSFTMFASQFTNTNTTATAPPVIKLSNTAPASAIIGIANSYISYTSITVDTGLNKCCIQLATTAGATATVNLLYTFLYCEGARVTNGTPGAYLCVQNPGLGSITVAFAIITAGNTAFRLPNGSAKFVKGQYANVV